MVLDNEIPKDKVIQRNVVTPLRDLWGREDEITKKKVAAQQDEFEPLADPEIHSTHSADRGGGHFTSQNGTANPNGLNISSLSRLTAAIRDKTNIRPENLNLEEKELWDTIQSVLTTQKCAFADKFRVVEKKLRESATADSSMLQNSDMSTNIDHLKSSKTPEQHQHSVNKHGERVIDESQKLKEQLTKLQNKYDSQIELSKTQQEEHDCAIRAIQRVLADINEKKDKKVEELELTIEKLKTENLALEPRKIEAKQADNPDITSLRARAQRAFQLESEMEELKDMQTKIESERDQLHDELDQKTAQLKILKQEMHASTSEIPKNAGDEVSAGSPDDARIKSLEQEVEEKNISLENAKKLIASLECANGSMASDMRLKLKKKEEEVLKLQQDGKDRRRIMESLATTLKALQRDKLESDRVSARAQESQRLLVDKLDVAIKDLESATAKLDSSDGSDEDIMDKISVILCNSLMAMKLSLSALENGDSAVAASYDYQQRPGVENNQWEVESLKESVRKNEARVKSLESSLLSAEGEIVLLKLKNDSLQQSQGQDETKLHNDIRRLRDECKTNMEVLTKKEQELQVLRDSLEVGDDVGYISGDESDEDVGEYELDVGSVQTRCTYDASRAQALATLLVHSGSGVEITGSVDPYENEQLKDEVKRAKRDNQSLREELKSERDSLANAKMIISSLEKANKTMLEDLRLRLQDSNTAIAGLLDKSMTNERAANDTKEELENLKAEARKAEAKHRSEVAKLKKKIAHAN